MVDIQMNNGWHRSAYNAFLFAEIFVHYDIHLFQNLEPVMYVLEES